MKRLFEAVFVEQCAPTLAGLKPSNLYSFRSSDDEAVKRVVSEMNHELREYRLSIRILKQCRETGFSLIYVYRTTCVDSILFEEANRDFLIRSGYEVSDFDAILQQSSERLIMERQFPHEIGIFLGYPRQDVIGFI